MIYYLDKVEMEVYAYDTPDEARIYHHNYENLERIDSDKLKLFIDKPSEFHMWNGDGWVLPSKYENEYKIYKLELKLSKLNEELYNLRLDFGIELSIDGENKEDYALKIRKLEGRISEIKEEKKRLEKL